MAQARPAHREYSHLIGNTGEGVHARHAARDGANTRPACQATESVRHVGARLLVASVDQAYAGIASRTQKRIQPVAAQCRDPLDSAPAQGLYQ